MSKVLTENDDKFVSRVNNLKYEVDEDQGGLMNTQTKTITTEILYQKIGNTWYAFTEVEGEFLFRALPHGVDPRKTQIEFTQVIPDQEIAPAKKFEMAA